VAVSGVSIDVGVESHETLGLSYLVSLGVRVPWRSNDHGL
jgi:hypothetical protein